MTSLRRYTVGCATGAGGALTALLASRAAWLTVALRPVAVGGQQYPGLHLPVEHFGVTPSRLRGGAIPLVAFVAAVLCGAALFAPRGVRRPVLIGAITASAFTLASSVRVTFDAAKRGARFAFVTTDPRLHWLPIALAITGATVAVAAALLAYSSAGAREMTLPEGAPDPDLEDHS